MKKSLSIAIFFAILLLPILGVGQKFSELSAPQAGVYTYRYILVVQAFGNDSIPKVELKIDDYGNFVQGKKDTIATSCELAADMETLFQHYLTFRSPVIDSAYSYREQVEFYRKWFGKNITPDPLKRMAEKRS